MANADTRVTLDALHNAIGQAIANKFPTLATVESYRLDRKALPLPACLFELVEFETSDDAMDPGTEQLAVTARFEARFFIGFKTPNAKVQIRKLAAAFAAFARLNRWGVPVGPAQVIGAYPDDFDPELDQFECWRVEWTQVVHLGEPLEWDGSGLAGRPEWSGGLIHGVNWDSDGTDGNPVGPVYSWVPKVGIGNEHYYRPLGQLLPPGTELEPE